MNRVKITWLGQAGLLIETASNVIIVDPYLSDSVEKIEPKNKRRVSVNKRFLEVKPTVIVLTHDHLDHTDPDTLKHYLTEDSNVCVLASANAWKRVRAFGGNNNYVQFDSGTSWTEGDDFFLAVPAKHSDGAAVGVILRVDGKTYYVTGDTLYNEEIFAALPAKIDYVFLPVNGKGNNMNMVDAKRFCERIGCVAIPMHCGLFDSLDMNNFGYENKVVPSFYEEIKL